MTVERPVWATAVFKSHNFPLQHLGRSSSIWLTLSPLTLAQRSAQVGQWEAGIEFARFNERRESSVLSSSIVAREEPFLRRKKPRREHAKFRNLQWQRRSNKVRALTDSGRGVVLIDRSCERLEVVGADLDKSASHLSAGSSSSGLRGVRWAAIVNI